MSLTTTETPTQNLLVTPREDKEQTPCEAISHGDILPGMPPNNSPHCFLYTRQ